MYRNKLAMYTLLLAIGGFVGVLIGISFSPSPVAATLSRDSHSLSAGAPLTETNASHKSTASQPVASDWCAEHRFPESECTICLPELIPQFKAEGNWCSVHNYPEQNCRPCNPNLTFPQEPREPVTAEPVQMSVFFPQNTTGCATDRAIIRFSTAATADRIGLRVEPVVLAKSAPSHEAPAEIVLDETRVCAITVGLPATVTRWLVDPGEEIAPKQPLAELQSPEMADLKAQYLTAVAGWTRDHLQWKRAVDLHRSQMISLAEMDEFEAREKAAHSQLRGLEGQLRSLGLDNQDIDSLNSGREVGGTWLLRSERGGAVIERLAALGERLDAGSTFALVGDPSALWIQAHVREQDLSQLKLGQEIEFTADGESLARAGGKVIWISQYLEPDTRTGIVRASMTGSDNRLRAHLFGRARFSDLTGSNALLVSKDAVQWEGCCNVAFVQEAIDRYRPVKVTIGRGDNRQYRVESGLREGDLVVTAGSFLLKTELKKESLGVGCAGE